MKLLLVRHADAGDRDEFAKTGEPDHLRPLSDKGREQMKGAVEGLRKLVPSADLIVTSPYTRAAQTARIVGDAYGNLPREETSTLEPEVAPAEFEAWLKGHAAREVIVAVGHEPHMGAMATWLMCGGEESRVEMKKGGACLLVFDKRPKKGTGTLRWLMGPKELGALG
jgi:phosphohistidine phosphatase